MKRMTWLLSALSFSVVLGAVGCEGGGEGEGEGEEGEGEEGEGEEGEGDEGEGDEGEGEGDEGEGEGEGEGDIPALDLCQEECVDNDDCLVGGSDAGNFDCVNGRCKGPDVPPPPPCTTDEACTAQTSFMTTACTANADCFGGFTPCIDVDGAGTGPGLCATSQPTAGACTFGSVIDGVDIAGAAVQYCGTESVCNEDNDLCETPPCTVDDDCSGDLKCRADDGKCVVCLADADCAGNAAGENCLENLGVCGCTQNADCDGGPTGDICFDGFCGCNAVADCNGDTVFDGTSYVCEGFGA